MPAFLPIHSWALWNYAQNFGISNNHFGTTLGPSIPGAINVVSGQTLGAVDLFLFAETMDNLLRSLVIHSLVLKVVGETRALADAFHRRGIRVDKRSP